MPSYTARCDDCGSLTEYSIGVKDRYLTPPCEVCDSECTRLVVRQAPVGFVKGRFEAFKSPVDGSIISTAQGLADHNKRNNVVNIHDGYSEEAISKGSYLRPPPKPDKKEIAQAVVESIHKVEAGYKPVRENQDAD